MSIAEIFETMEYGPAPESASPAVRWLEERGRTFGHFIGGEWRDPAEGEYFDTINPATNKPLARIAQGGAADVNAAVRAAREALPGWQALDGHARARYLYALARHIQRHSRLFAVLESMDNGKPIRESRDIDIPLVARHFYHHAGWAQLMDAEMPGYTGIGVVGQIIPWNFPLLMMAWKIAPALAMGNTVVLKPAEFTSLTALLFAEVCRDAGLPPGVVNIITGDGRTGAAIVEHPDVDKIAFTGSTDVGRIIRVATAGSGKKLSLELGGKSPFVVFEDGLWATRLEMVVHGDSLVGRRHVYGDVPGSPPTIRRSTTVGARSAATGCSCPLTFIVPVALPVASPVALSVALLLASSGALPPALWVVVIAHASAMRVPRSMLMPHVNWYDPGDAGVSSMAVRWPVGRYFRMPKSGNTTSSLHPDVSRRSKTRRTGCPAFTRTTFGA